MNLLGGMGLGLPSGNTQPVGIGAGAAQGSTGVDPVRGAGHPLDDQLRALIQGLQVLPIPPMDAIVRSQADDGSLELELQVSDDTRVRYGVQGGYQGVPLYIDALLPANTSVALEFLDNDPQKPFVRSYTRGVPRELTIEASQRLNLGGKDGQDAARKGDAVATTEAMATWMSQVCAGITAGGGTAPSPPVPASFGQISGGSSIVRVK